MKRRPIVGDGIPSVSDYAHWGEEAEAVWYAENRYDMDHWDEPTYEDDMDDWYEDETEDPTLFADDFNVFEEQQVFLDNEGDFDPEGWEE